MARGRPRAPGAVALSDPAPDPFDRVVAARDALAAAQDDLRAAVADARAAGRSWAEVGAVLGVTRQAAFKRFAAPSDPRDPSGATPMTRRTGREVAALAQRALGLLAAGDLAALHELMAPDAARLLPASTLGDAWARAVADTGPLVTQEPLGARHPDSTPLGDDEDATGTLVGVVRLVCEAGEWEGRVASDGDGRVTGLLVCPPGAEGLPF